MESSMKSRQRSSALILVLLLAATVYVLIRTGTSTPNFIGPTTTAVANPTEAEIVDQRPLQTAQQFAKMPTASEEKPFAEGALELADKEMDLAFAATVLDTQEHPPVLSAAAKVIQARLQKAEDALDSSKKRVDAITASETKRDRCKKNAHDDHPVL